MKMEIEIIDDEENPLLNRREINFEATFTGPTPSRDKVRNKLVAMIDANENLTIIDSYETKYGKNRVKGLAKIYDDAENMEIEPDYKIEKNFPEEEEEESEEEEEEE